MGPSSSSSPPIVLLVPLALLALLVLHVPQPHLLQPRPGVPQPDLLGLGAIGHHEPALLAAVLARGGAPAQCVHQPRGPLPVQAGAAGGGGGGGPGSSGGWRGEI